MAFVSECTFCRGAGCVACYNTGFRPSGVQEAVPTYLPDDKELTATQEAIVAECDAVKEMLLEKNRKYGDSAVNPKRIFSKADAVEQINVRLDDKISRIMSSQVDDDEDPELDMIGYMLLKRVIRRLKND